MKSYTNWCTWSLFVWYSGLFLFVSENRTINRFCVYLGRIATTKSVSQNNHWGLMSEQWEKSQSGTKKTKHTFSCSDIKPQRLFCDRNMQKMFSESKNLNYLSHNLTLGKKFKCYFLSKQFGIGKRNKRMQPNSLLLLVYIPQQSDELQRELYASSSVLSTLNSKPQSSPQNLSTKQIFKTSDAQRPCKIFRERRTLRIEVLVIYILCATLLLTVESTPLVPPALSSYPFLQQLHWAALIFRPPPRT